MYTFLPEAKLLLLSSLTSPLSIWNLFFFINFPVRAYFRCGGHAIASGTGILFLKSNQRLLPFFVGKISPQIKFRSRNSKNIIIET
jgi:ribosomal protein L24E